MSRSRDASGRDQEVQTKEGYRNSSTYWRKGTPQAYRSAFTTLNPPTDEMSAQVQRGKVIFEILQSWESLLTLSVSIKKCRQKGDIRTPPPTDAEALHKRTGQHLQPLIPLPRSFLPSWRFYKCQDPRDDFTNVRIRETILQMSGSERRFYKCQDPRDDFINVRIRETILSNVMI